MNVPLKPLKWYKKLQAKKGRMEHGVFLVEGQRAIDQIVCSQPQAAVEMVATEDIFEYSHQYPFRVVTSEQFSAISSTKTPQGIMAVVRLPDDIYADRLPPETGQKILLLEDIQDPGNVGTLIRTAAAFDFPGVILTEKCADPLSPKCVQASAGTILSLWIRRTPDYLSLVKKLKGKGFHIAAADLSGDQSPKDAFQQNPILLALGSEAFGLSGSLLALADTRIKIPIEQDKAQSLNAAVSGGILMYLASEK